MAALYEYLTKLSERLIKLLKKLMQLPDELISLRRRNLKFMIDDFVTCQFTNIAIC